MQSYTVGIVYVIQKSPVSMRFIMDYSDNWIEEEANIGIASVVYVPCGMVYRNTVHDVIRCK